MDATLNVAAFALFGIDKWKARNDGWRKPRTETCRDFKAIILFNTKSCTGRKVSADIKSKVTPCFTDIFV